MARATNGDYKGLIGPSVITTWKGINVLKTKPGTLKKRKQMSEQQIDQTGLFTAVNTLLKALRSVIDISFPQPTKMMMTPFNAAISINMLNALVDFEGHKYIDYSKVCLSKSKNRTQQLWNPTVTALADRKFIVSWELTPFPQKCTQDDDLVKIMYCSKQDPKFIPVPGFTARDVLSRTFVPNTKLIGHDVFVYVVVISADLKRVAVTDFLGMHTVLA